jgi:hypothetical protein
MGEEPDQIERHICDERNQLGEDIHELQQKVRTAVDWRAQVNQRPWVMLGAAFGGGLLLSVLFSARRNSHRSSRDGSRQSSRSTSHQVEYAERRRSQELDEKTSSLWNNIRAAALAVAGSKLSSLIERVLPGFQEQYRKRQHQGSSTGSRHNGPESAWRKNASGETDSMPQS